MRQRLMRTIVLAFIAIALTLSPSLMTEQATVFAQTTGAVHHPVSPVGQVVRRKPVRRGAIGAGGAGTYAKSKRRRTVRKVKPIKKKPVWDDTDIVH